MRNNRFLYIITLSYFILGIVNIHFALLGLVCMTIPFILLFKNKKKTWCQGYCPRANLYSTCGKLKKSSHKTPKYFIKGNLKWIMLIYFGISLFIIIMSTLKVSSGSIEPMKYLRYFIVIPIPWELPQFITYSDILPWVTHLSYRFYSMMLTTTTIGLILALIYKPRTWCTICPIGTMSDAYLKGLKKH